LKLLYSTYSLISRRMIEPTISTALPTPPQLIDTKKAVALVRYEHIPSRALRIILLQCRPGTGRIIRPIPREAGLIGDVSECLTVGTEFRSVIGAAREYFPVTNAK
jgi:hypothetical protein